MKTALERLKMINNCNHPDGVIRFSHDKLKSIIEQLEEERGAIPTDVQWPLFEDGLTVLVGDEFEHDRCGTCKVESITFRNGYCVLNYGTQTAFVVGGIIGCDAERVKRPGFQKSKEIDASLTSYSDERPVPKVVDADGVVIELGDYVWNEVGTAFTVIEVNGKNKSFKAMRHYDGQECDGCRPSIFTHRAPVLAADGRPLHEGEAVWDEEGHEWRVDCLSTDFAPGHVRLRDFDGWVRYVEPDKLTHERPDSWERLDDDCTLPPRTYYARLIGHDAGIKSDEEIIAAVLRHVAGRAKALALTECDS